MLSALVKSRQCDSFGLAPIDVWRFLGEPAPWAFFNALIYKIAPCMGGPLFIEFHDFPGGPQRGSAGSARRRDANQPNAGTTAPSSLGLVARPNKAPSRRPQQVGPGKPNEAGFATCPRLRQHIPPAGYVMPAGYAKRRFNLDFSLKTLHFNRGLNAAACPSKGTLTPPLTPYGGPMTRRPRLRRRDPPQTTCQNPSGTARGKLDAF